MDTCKVCGNDEFYKGRLGSGTTSLRPLNKIMGSSFMILTFCSKCGEVSSIKVENPGKFS
ncbi:hypothetical protein SAMN05216362_12125 [Piscibacillus halophilus]|uniref:Nucleic-acid-binding protein containing Zn-ribbon domain n=1 Tax=Piscibacillus halophilus TaxID=571933 RepID=A0A1H9HV10_9BACI|nr:hypothetical protein SAMN05216362_12125 [Piscibacillus halophilus]